MAVIKCTSSGKAFQIVLSEDVPAGTVFQVAVAPVLSLPYKGGGKYFVLTRMGNLTNPSKFPVSEVYGQDFGQEPQLVYDKGKDRLNGSVKGSVGKARGLKDKTVEF